MILQVRLHYCFQFIKHYLGATLIDVLHSPFVFALYNACIRKQKHNLYTEADKLASDLRNDTSFIEQADYGSGVAVTRKRQVRSFAVLHAKPRRIITILANLIHYFSYKECIELGTSLGISAAYQGLALQSNHNGGKLITIEGAPELSALANRNFKKAGLADTVVSVAGNFMDKLPQVLAEKEKIDYVFIDGDHRYEPTVEYFNMLLPKMHNESVLVFDDIYWSRGMTKAWEEIKRHPQVTVTVDLFFVGLVFFRKEQRKEHFKLRIL